MKFTVFYEKNIILVYKTELLKDEYIVKYRSRKQIKVKQR